MMTIAASAIGWNSLQHCFQKHEGKKNTCQWKITTGFEPPLHWKKKIFSLIEKTNHKRSLQVAVVDVSAQDKRKFKVTV